MTLEAIQAALAAATPGPWEWNDEQALVAPGVETYVVNPWAECADDFGLEVSNADAHLIANAPEWLQALVDVAVAAQGFGHCFAPAERSATPEEVDEGCELGIAYDDCGFCSGCKLRDKLAALEQRSAP